jgi:hypothetical protein
MINNLVRDVLHMRSVILGEKVDDLTEGMMSFEDYQKEADHFKEVKEKLGKTQLREHGPSKDM